jgi:hypothetical protein
MDGAAVDRRPRRASRPIDKAITAVSRALGRATEAEEKAISHEGLLTGPEAVANVALVRAVDRLVKFAVVGDLAEWAEALDGLQHLGALGIRRLIIAMNKARTKPDRFRLMLSLGAIGQNHLPEVLVALQEVVSAHFDDDHVAVFHAVHLGLRPPRAGMRAGPPSYDGRATSGPHRSGR